MRSPNPGARGEPHANDRLTLDDATYTFLPHPLLPAATGEPYALEGAEAVVYQLRREPDGALFALKTPKPAYRGPLAVAVTQALARLAMDDGDDTVALGFAVARRVCLTRAAYPAVSAQWPCLEYAALAPWVAGRSWASLLLDRQASQAYTPGEALARAGALARALWRLEGLRGAHTDLAGDNLILTPTGCGIELLDFEGVYLPTLPRPPRVSQGTAGYQPPYLTPSGTPPRHTERRRWPWRRSQTTTTPDDLWRPTGDRFAGAILLTELLVWHDARVRAATPDGAESLFQPGELGRPSAADGPAAPKLAAVRAALAATHPSLLTLFDCAWAAPHLSDCPELGAWALALMAAREREGA